MQNWKWTIWVVLYAFCFTGVNAQFPGNEKKVDAFNLSLFGAEGIPEGEGIRLTKVFPGSPAMKAGIKEGALLLAEPIETAEAATTGEESETSKPSPEAYDPEKAKDSMGGVSKETKAKEKIIFDFIKRVEEASQSKSGKMVVKVSQRGATKDHTVRIIKLGKHSKDCPHKCKRCKAIVKHSLAWLAKSQKGGVWETTLGGREGKVVVTSVCGLALLAGGHYPGGKYGKNVAMALKYVLRVVGKKEDSPLGRQGGANWNQINWTLGYAPLFLVECYRRKPSAEIRNKLIELSRDLSKNQEPSGGWAHGPGGPNALNYLELSIMNNWCLAALGSMKQVKIPVDQTTIDKGIQYIIDSSSPKGGVGYSPNEGQKGYGDPGRTAGSIFAFAKVGKSDHEFYPKMSDYLYRKMEDVPNGHVSPIMHFMATALACSQLEEKFMEKFMKFFQLELLSARRPDGSFASRPTEESSKMRSNTDLDMGDNWSTGNYLIVLQLHQNKLKTIAKKKKR